MFSTEAQPALIWEIYSTDLGIFFPDAGSISPAACFSLKAQQFDVLYKIDRIPRAVPLRPGFDELAREMLTLFS